MKPRLFGVEVDEIVDVVLAQMNEETVGHENNTFVVNETSRLISKVTGDELVYLQALEIHTHTGSDIRRHILPEIDRRRKGQRVIAELLRKTGVDPTAEAVAAAWTRSEDARKKAGPREVPVRGSERFAKRA